MARPRPFVSALLAALLAVGLSSCAGGGGGAGVPVVRSSEPSGNAAGTLSLALPQPGTASSRRSPRFLSPSSSSVVIAVNGTPVMTADVSAGSSSCATSGTARRCTIAFSAPAGNDILTVDLFDGPSGNGNRLGTGTGSLTVVGGTPFTTSVQVRAVVASVALGVTGAFTSGIAATLPVSVTALDADGNTISGSDTFASPVTLTQSDTSGHIRLSATSVPSPATAVNLVYDGTAVGTPGTSTTITVGATLGGATVTPATVTLSTPRSTVLTNGDFSNNLTGWTTAIISTGSFGGYPKFGVSTSAPCYPAQNGNPFAYIDTPGNADGYFEQSFTVPMSASPTLTFRTWGNLDPVTTSVRLIIRGTESVLDTYTPPPLQSSPSTCSSATAVTKSYSLTPYAGQTVTLRIRSTAPGNNGTIGDYDDFVVQ